MQVVHGQQIYHVQGRMYAIICGKVIPKSTMNLLFKGSKCELQIQGWESIPYTNDSVEVVVPGGIGVGYLGIDRF